MNKDIERTVSRIRNLYQYKNKTEEELIEIAKKKVYHKTLEVENQFIDKEEKKRAKNLFNKYLEDNPYLENISEINFLNQLVYLEILNMRFQSVINTYVNSKNKATVPIHLVESYHKNLSKINEFKEKLGLFKQKEQTDAFSALETLKKRYEKHVNKYRHEFTMVCGECGRVQLLRRRTKDMGEPVKKDGKIIGYKTMKHPFFKGRILYNKKVVGLVKENKITLVEAAEILETSPDYIRWLIKKEM